MIFYKISFQHSQQLRGHRQDYVDTFGKFWRLLTDFKGTNRWKMYLGVFTHSIAIILKYEKEKKRSKEKSACPHNCCLCGHAIFELCDRISTSNRFFLFIRAQVPLRCCVILKENFYLFYLYTYIITLGPINFYNYRKFKMI